MGKKKKEHITFDQTQKTKKSMPFGKINTQAKQTTKSTMIRRGAK